jgi:hypothetical protein
METPIDKLLDVKFLPVEQETVWYHIGDFAMLVRLYDELGASRQFNRVLMKHAFGILAPVDLANELKELAQDLKGKEKTATALVDRPELIDTYNAVLQCASRPPKPDPPDPFKEGAIVLPPPPRTCKEH